MTCSSATYFAVPDTIVESVITTSSISIVHPVTNEVEAVLPPPLPHDTVIERGCNGWQRLGRRRRPRQRPPRLLGAEVPLQRRRSVLLAEKMRRLGAELKLPDSFGPVTLQHHLANVVHALEKLSIRLTCSRRPYGEHLELAELYERIYRRIVIDRLPAPGPGKELVIDLSE